MVISEKSQLGLRIKGRDAQVILLNAVKDQLEGRLESHRELIKKAESDDIEITAEFELQYTQTTQETRQVKEKISRAFSLSILESLIDFKEAKYFFICESVYKAAELIKIRENFTGRTLKDIKFGTYVYLMGKHEMVKFTCQIGAIHGYYYNDKSTEYFEFGVEMEEGKYFFDGENNKQFSTIMQLLTFIELGDIEVQILNARQSTAGKREDKTTNGTNNTVYVVDSSWNKLLIRTDGFAVRGHFRLQPCGDGMKDRKLIWINAFEKEGYTRKPKATIIR